MKRYIKYIIVILITLLSFYYCSEVSKFIICHTSLMKEINRYPKTIKPINAVIKGNYIIPGMNGLKVDNIKSYYNMQNSGTFNAKLLAYEEIKPLVSLDNYQNFIIIKGNPSKKAIAIINDNANDSITGYAKNNNIILSISKNNVLPIDVTNNNFYKIDINSGDIYKLSEDFKLVNFIIFIKKVNYFNYQVMSLEKLISEEWLQ